MNSGSRITIKGEPANHSLPAHISPPEISEFTSGSSCTAAPLSPSLPSISKDGAASPSSSSSAMDIEGLFQYSPPTLIQDINHTQSTHTRPPAFYDKHMDEDLILKEVKYCPELTSAFAMLADNTLQGFQSGGRKLPPPGLSLDFPTQKRVSHGSTAAITTSVLEESNVVQFHQSTTARFCTAVVPTLALQLSSWEQSFMEWTSTNSNRTEALADGYLRINPDNISKSDVPTEVAEDLRLLAETFPVLAVWEFKNLVAGGLDVMKGIVGLAEGDGHFNWQTCESQQKCRLVHRSQNAAGIKTVTGHRTGPDAKRPSIVVSESPREKQTPPCTVKIQTSARHIGQQIWAECVINDTTFVVIQSGNYEILAMRNRSKGILYVSDVIEVSRISGYGKIQVGLYIAAYNDAWDRTLQVHATDAQLPESWYKTYDTDATLEQETLRKMSDVQKREWHKALQIMIRREANSRNVLTLTPGQQHKLITRPFIADTPYIRGAAFVPQATVETLAFFTVVIGSVEPSDKHVFNGRLSVNGKYLNRAVVVKNADSPSRLHKLQLEYQAYQVLHRHKVLGIPKIFGFFQHSESSEYGALVMECAGSPLDLSKAKRSDLNSCKAILRAIHCTGLVHGKLNMRNLLVRGCKVSIIGFRKLHTASLKRQHAERNRLKNILANRPRRCRPRACAVHIGPFDENVTNPMKTFKSLTQWMDITLDAVLRVTAARLPIWLDVDFRDFDERKAFYSMWYSDERPEEYRDIECYNVPDEPESGAEEYSQSTNASGSLDIDAAETSSNCDTNVDDLDEGIPARTGDKRRVNGRLKRS